MDTFSTRSDFEFTLATTDALLDQRRPQQDDDVIADAESLITIRTSGLHVSEARVSAAIVPDSTKRARLESAIEEVVAQAARQASAHATAASQEFSHLMAMSPNLEHWHQRLHDMTETIDQQYADQKGRLARMAARGSRA